MAKTTTKAKTNEQDNEGAIDAGATRAPAVPASEPAGTSAPAPAGEASSGLPGSDPAGGTDPALALAVEALTSDLTAIDPLHALIPAGTDIEIIGIDLAAPAPGGEPGNPRPLPDGATSDGGRGADAGEITVICHAPGGRRRLGRRWPEGTAYVQADRLSDTDIELLRSDPKFSVIPPT